MNIGYFTSFTAFLALNDADFCNSYLRESPQAEGILPLAGYLRFWGWFFAVVTILIALFKHETNFQPAGTTMLPHDRSFNCCCVCADRRYNLSLAANPATPYPPHPPPISQVIYARYGELLVLKVCVHDTSCAKAGIGFCIICLVATVLMVLHLEQ